MYKKKPAIMLICKKDLKTDEIACVKDRRATQRRNADFYLKHNLVQEDLKLPEKIVKNEVLEMKKIPQGNNCLRIISLKINLNAKEIAEYFETELVSSRTLKLRKLSIIRKEEDQ